MHDRRRARVGQIVRQPSAHSLHGRDLARLVHLPQPREASQLPLEIAGRLAKALQSNRPPVHRVNLRQRLDQLLGDHAPLRRYVQGPRDAGDHHLARDALHHVEGAADRGRVLAHGEHHRDARRGVAQGAQEPRLAQHVVRAGGQRRARRAAQHVLVLPAPDQIRHVGVALADRARLDLARTERVPVEKLAQWLEHEQRRTLVAARLRGRVDDVVCRHR